MTFHPKESDDTQRKITFEVSFGKKGSQCTNKIYTLSGTPETVPFMTDRLLSGDNFSPPDQGDDGYDELAYNDEEETAAGSEEGDDSSPATLEVTTDPATTTTTTTAPAPATTTAPATASKPEPSGEEGAADIPKDESTVEQPATKTSSSTRCCVFSCFSSSADDD